MGADGQVRLQVPPDGASEPRQDETAGVGLTAQLRRCMQRGATGFRWSRTSLQPDVARCLEHVASAAYGISAILNVLQANHLAECEDSHEVLDGFTAAGLFAAASQLAMSSSGVIDQLRDAYPELPR